MDSEELSNLEKKYNIIMRPPSTSPPPLISPEENLSEPIEKEARDALKYFQEKEKLLKNRQKLEKYFQEKEKRDKFTQSLKKNYKVFILNKRQIKK